MEEFVCNFVIGMGPFGGPRREFPEHEGHISPEAFERGVVQASWDGDAFTQDLADDVKMHIVVHATNAEAVRWYAATRSGSVTTSLPGRRWSASSPVRASRVSPGSCARTSPCRCGPTWSDARSMSG